MTVWDRPRLRAGLASGAPPSTVRAMASGSQHSTTKAMSHRIARSLLVSAPMSSAIYRMGGASVYPHAIADTRAISISCIV
jgi:hypothetical protein